MSITAHEDYDDYDGGGGYEGGYVLGQAVTWQALHQFNLH